MPDNQVSTILRWVMLYRQFAPGKCLRLRSSANPGHCRHRLMVWMLTALPGKHLMEWILLRMWPQANPSAEAMRGELLYVWHLFHVFSCGDYMLMNKRIRRQVR